MKVPLGVLALCLALCHSSLVPGFKEGKKYIYEYTAVYGSGISDEAVTQFAGRGLKGELHVYNIDNHLAVELHKVEVAEFNKRLDSIFDVSNLDYRAPTDPEEIKMVSEFETPWYGEFGKDGRFVASKHSNVKENVHTNLQRAILSLLQVVLPETNASNNFYTVEESGIGGDCQTSYVINHFPDEIDGKEEVLNITKNYLYDQCAYKPESLFTSMIGYRCEQCGEENYEEFINTGHVEYEIKGNRQDYIIENIYATGYIGYTPFTTNGQTAMSITNQTLRLIRVEDVSPSAIPGDAEKIEGLYFRFNAEGHEYDDEDLKENHVFDRVYPAKYVQDRYSEDFSEETDRIAQATSLLPKVFGFHGNYNGSNIWRGFEELAKLTDRFRHVMFAFDYDDFQKFFDQNINIAQDGTTKERDTRNYILKILTIVGTNPSILFALDLIRTEKVPEALEVDMITTLPFHAKTASKPLLEEYKKFVKSPYINTDSTKPLFSVAWEAYGTLIYRACVKDDYNHRPAKKDTFVDKEYCKEYVQDIIDNLKDAEKSEDKCVYTSALRNTQTEEAYRYLVDELIPATGQKYDEFVRATAIEGLEHHLDEEHDEEITATLMPILTDVNEDFQIRIYALDKLIYLDQDTSFYSNLAMMVNEEPDRQVASYVWSSLSNIANTTDPCYENIAKHARTILPRITRKDYDYDFLRHSTNKIFSYYNQQYGFGRTTRFTSIGGDNTAVPRAIHLMESLNVGGHNFDLAEVGVMQRNSHGIDSIVAAAMQQYNLMIGPEMRGEEEYGFAKNFDMEKFLNGMSIQVFSRLFGQDVSVAHYFQPSVESAYIKEVEKRKLDITYINILSAANVEFITTNMIGLPTHLQLFAPAVARLDGDFYFGSETPDAAFIKPYLQYVVDINVQTSILIDNPFSGSSGYELRTEAGLKFTTGGEYSIDLKNQELNLKKIFVDYPYTLLHYKTQPYTFTRNSHALPVKYSDKPVQLSHKLGHDYLGVGLKLNLEYDKFWNDYGSYRNVFENFFRKSTRHEDYYDLIDRFYAGTTGFLDHALLNPKGRPFSLTIGFEPGSDNPTLEMTGRYKFEKSDYYDEEKSFDKQAWSSEKHRLEIVTNSTNPRKWLIELDVDRHWPVVNFRRVKFYWKRNAIPTYDDKPYEVCYESETTIKGREEIVASPLNPAKEAEIKYESTLKVGRDCADDSKQIEVKAKFTKSQEQRDVDHEKLKIYLQCQADLVKNHEFSNACWKVKKDQGRLDQVKLDIGHDVNVDPRVQEFLDSLNLWFRHSYYDNMRIESDVDTGVAENHIRVEANFSYYQPIVDIHVQKPGETMHFDGIFAPNIIPRYEPVTIVGESFEARYLKRGLGLRLKTPMCFLSGDHMKTLDGVSYKYKMGKCYHVAVANCLRENVVLMYKAVEDGKYSKAMKLVVDDHNIEIKPETDKLVAYVDGKKVLDDDKKHAHILKDVDKHLLAVYRKYDGYVIEARTSGLEVYFDGQNSRISVSNFYHGVQCGLCGDFNNEARGEFRQVNGTLYKNSRDFGQSYAIRKPDCDQ